MLLSFRARNSKVQQGMEEGEHGEAGEDLAALDKDYEDYSQSRLGCLTGSGPGAQLRQSPLQHVQEL